MGRPKKDAKYLNVYIEKNIYTRLENFCKEQGQSKTVAAERALTMYMDSKSTAASPAPRKEYDS